MHRRDYLEMLQTGEYVLVDNQVAVLVAAAYLRATILNSIDWALLLSLDLVRLWSSNPSYLDLTYRGQVVLEGYSSVAKVLLLLEYRTLSGAAPFQGLAESIIQVLDLKYLPSLLTHPDKWVRETAKDKMSELCIG